MQEDRNISKLNEEGLEYNTQREKIILGQYGRNIQKLVEYCMTLEDKNDRNLAAQQIIEAMEIINPRVKSMENYKKVLWTHLAIISNYQLDVDYPFEIEIEKEIKTKPEPIKLERKPPKMRQYGKIVEKMIEQAKDIEDEKMREAYVEMILIQMKRIYIDWNRDVVNDKVIFDDFKKLAGDGLEIPENFKLPTSYEIRNRYTRSYHKKYKKNQNKRTSRNGDN